MSDQMTFWPSFEEFEARLARWASGPSEKPIVLPIVVGSWHSPDISQFWITKAQWNRSKGERLKVYQAFMAECGKEVKAEFLPQGDTR